MTPDGQELFFTRAGPDWTSTILTLRREGKGWSEPSVASFAEGQDAVYPFVSLDGRYLFFCSNRGLSPTNGVRRSSSFEDFMKRIEGPGNGNQDIYWMDARIIEELRAAQAGTGRMGAVSRLR